MRHLVPLLLVALSGCPARSAEPATAESEGAETTRLPEPEPATPPPEVEELAEVLSPRSADAGPAPVEPGSPAEPARAPRSDLPAVGETLPAPDATDTDVDAAWNSFLTNRARADCTIDVPLSWLHDRCRPLRPRRVSTSAPDASTLASAFDLDACTTFHAGAAPAVVELELERAETIDLLVIDPGPASSGVSRHVIETPDRRGRWVPRTVLFGGYYDSVLYALRFPEPVTTRRLRIRTITSPGAVEHREIVPVVCDGEVVIHVEGIAPEPDPVPPQIDWHDPRYTHHPGAGRCRRDEDCAPQSCCGGRMCGLRRTAPDCEGVGCGSGCGSPLDCGHGACICHEGMCSLATDFSADDPRVSGP